MLEDIKTYLGDDWDRVLEGIRAYLSTDIDLLGRTNDGLLEHPGKQLRPLLALLVARACSGAVYEDTVRFAIASELLHNATLLHDDVADEADTRRGKPTVRVLLGPNASVLVGDFWLVKAMCAVLDGADGQDRVIRIFSRTLSDLAEGEMLQLQKAALADTGEEDYFEIIYRKTASLFAATSLSAAISVNASEDVEQAAADFGKYLGLAFQIRDDIFDYMPESGIGKPVGVDIVEKKITLPLLCAFGNAGKDEEIKIREKIKDGGKGVRDEVIAFVRENGGIQKAQEILEEYIGKAIGVTGVFPWSRDRELLVCLAETLSHRTV